MFGGDYLANHVFLCHFVHVALVEYEEDYCKVLQQNRPEWNVICGDVHDFDGRPYCGVDLLAGGVPCPPFSVAGKQLGKEDERDHIFRSIQKLGYLTHSKLLNA